MSTGILIITAAAADVKLVNRVLLHLRDWEYGVEGSWDRFHVARTKTEALTSGEADVPPVQVFDANEWETISLKDVEDFKAFAAEGSLFLVLDDQGVRDGTIIVAEQAINPDPDSTNFYLDQINKVRVPWQEAYIMWCNLDIANVDFEEFCDQETGKDGDSWWTYGPIEPESHYAEIAQRRDAAIKELEKLDLA